MKNVHYVQKKVLNKIYAYHVIIQIIIMKNLIMKLLKALYLKIALIL